MQMREQTRQKLKSERAQVKKTSLSILLPMEAARSGGDDAKFFTPRLVVVVVAAAAAAATRALFTRLFARLERRATNARSHAAASTFCARAYEQESGGGRRLQYDAAPSTPTSAICSVKMRSVQCEFSDMRARLVHTKTKNKVFPPKLCLS